MSFELFSKKLQSLMWHGCLQAMHSTLTDRCVRKHAQRTWFVSAAACSQLKVLTGDQDLEKVA